MTNLGFVHVPSLDLNGDIRGAGAPLVLSRLGTIERTTFSEIVIDTGNGFSANLNLAAAVARRTESLRIVVSLPLLDTTPLDAAEKIAALDEESGGRISLYIDLKRVPEGLDHLETLQRADEFVVLMKRFWANEQPITFEGNFYRCTETLLRRKGPQRAGIPIWTSGASGSAIQFAGRHADVFLLRPGDFGDVSTQIDRILAARSQFGRSCCPRFVLPISAAAGAQDVSPDALVIPADPVRASRFLLNYARVGATDFAVLGLNETSAIAEFSLRLAVPTADLARRGSGPSPEAAERSADPVSPHLPRSTVRPGRRTAP